MPTSSNFISDASLMEEYFDREFGEEMFFQLTVEQCVSSVLLYMKRFLMIKKGIFEFNKFRVIDVYKKESPYLINERVFDLMERALREGHVLTNEEEGLLRGYGERLRMILNEVLLKRMSFRIPSEG